MIPGHPLRYAIDTLYYTDDGGTNWHRSSATMLDTGLPLAAIAFGSPQVGMAVGTPGRVQQTIDGGVTWSQLPRPLTATTHGPMVGVAFSTPRVAFVLGNIGYLWRYQLDGEIPPMSVPGHETTTTAWRVSARDGGVDVAFTLSERLAVDVGLFDATGRLVRSAIDARMLEPGAHGVRIDVGDLATGAYVVQLRTAEKILSMPIGIAR